MRKRPRHQVLRVLLLLYDRDCLAVTDTADLQLPSRATRMMSTSRVGTPLQMHTPSCTTLICGSREANVLAFHLVDLLACDVLGFLPTHHCAAALTAPLLLKVVSLGDQLLLNLVTLNSAEQEPKQLELSVDHYTTSKSGDTSTVSRGSAS